MKNLEYHGVKIDLLYPYGVYDEKHFSTGVTEFKFNGFKYARDEEHNVFILDEEDDPIYAAGTWDQVKKTIVFENDFDPIEYATQLPPPRRKKTKAAKATASSASSSASKPRGMQDPENKTIVFEKNFDPNDHMPRAPMSDPEDSDLEESNEEHAPVDFDPGEGFVRVNYKNLKLAFDPSTNYLFRFYDENDEGKPWFMVDDKVVVGMWDSEKEVPLTITDMDDEGDMHVYIMHEGKKYAYDLEEFELFELDDDVEVMEFARDDQYEHVGAWSYETNEPLFNIDELTEVEYLNKKLHHDKVKHLFNITEHGRKHLVGMWDMSKGEPEFLEDEWDVKIKMCTRCDVTYYYDTYDYVLYTKKDDDGDSSDSGIIVVGKWDTRTNQPCFDYPIEDYD